MADHRPRARIRPGALLLADLCMFPRVGKGQDKPSVLPRNVTKRQTDRARQKANSPFFEIDLVLLRFDHVTSVIGNADHGIMRAAAKLCLADLRWLERFS